MWTTLDQALEHPAYQRPAQGFTGQGGITWLHRWAITAGLPSSIFRGEPEVPDWVQSLLDATRTTPPESHPATMDLDRVKVHRFRSTLNDVEYELRVSLPPGYADSERRYPVVYLLDANYSFLIARGIVNHLSTRDDLPKVITVGVGYSDGDDPRNYRLNRSRDYTPTFVADGGYGPEYQKASGGGPEFLKILQAELVPFLDGLYRSLPVDRTLVGHSFGGLFAAWTLLSEPGFFDNYVIVSPSLWYDQQATLQLERSVAERRDSLPARAYLCVGSREVNRHHDMVQDLRTFTNQLQEHSYQGLSFRAKVLADETHNSVFPGCLSNGLRYVLRGN